MGLLSRFFKKKVPSFSLDEFKKIPENDRWKFLTELMDPYFMRNRYRTYQSDVLSFSEPLRTYFICDTLYTEVYNGGLIQFFTNSSGIFTPYVSEALNTIGAIKTNEIFNEALEVIQRYSESHATLSKNLTKVKRGEVFRFAEIFENQELVNALSDLDTAFYDCTEKIDELAVEFVFVFSG